MELLTQAVTTAGGMQPTLTSAVPTTTGISSQIPCAVNAVSEVNARTHLMAIKTPMETPASGIRTIRPRVELSITPTSKPITCAAFAAAGPEVELIVSDLLSKKCASTQT